MPAMMSMAVGEMAMGANQSLAMYPGLTAAAYGALIATGADWMKQHIVPKMVSGEWAGTMCLTEPGCGTDLRLMKTRAVEQPDGTYQHERHQDFHFGRRPGPHRQHHPYGDRQDPRRERPDP